MDDLLTMLKNADDFRYLGGVGADELSEVEEKLELSFARDYREYVIAFGVAAFADHELTGISKSERLSVLCTTERARSFYPNFPADMYVIEELQIDNVLITQNSKGTIFSYGPNDNYEQIARSLKEYLFSDYVETENL